MAPKAQKKPARAMKAGRSRSPRRGSADDPSRDERLVTLKAYVVNLERRPDRWARVSGMLKKETPWLNFEQLKASDGSKNPIPEEEVTSTWNTSCNAHYADYFEWVFDAPGTELDGTRWKWACDADSDKEWKFKEKKYKGEEWSYVWHASEKDVVRSATVQKLATKETFNLRLQFDEKSKNPGNLQRMSGGERGCAHSHLRAWKLASERLLPTLVLEDDVQMVFPRTAGKGTMSGKIFTDRLAKILRAAPWNFDVIYLGWSGWRGGHYRHLEEDKTEPRNKLFVKAEYVWTTVAYVISQGGAKKLLAAARPLNQPVDNFMAWEASQGRLNAFVALDAGDEDGTWAGGIVDQNDFAGDSDIPKSDGGLQGDDAKDFAVAE